MGVICVLCITYKCCRHVTGTLPGVMEFAGINPEDDLRRGTESNLLGPEDVEILETAHI